ncbi:MAG: transposase [Patescibacteria group bacterium]|nr:transposase [Patescibacteria group bacterium]
MPRPPRIEYPGALYHITSRGNEKKNIYTYDQDRMTFLDILHDATDEYNWICHAYCLLNNHYHILIETPDANLSAGMKQLNGNYAQIYNKTHSRVGHLFGGRFGSIIIEKDPHLFEVARYVVLNPVRAGLVDQPKNWIWSSYHATAGLDKTPDFLNTKWTLELFSNSEKKAREEYKYFVSDGIKASSPFKSLVKDPILGSRQFKDKIKKHIK